MYGKIMSKSETIDAIRQYKRKVIMFGEMSWEDAIFHLTGDYGTSYHVVIAPKGKHIYVSRA